MKKYTKKELREAASSAILGLLTRFELPISGKTKKIAKDASKVLARQIADEHKRLERKLRKKVKSGLN